MSHGSTLALCFLLLAGRGLSPVGVQGRALRPPRSPVQVTQAPQRVGDRVEGFVEVVDHLPAGCVTDASVDYTVQVQEAIDAAAGRTLLLPDFPVLVSRRPGANWCLCITRPMVVRGSASSVLREKAGGVQILRAQGVAGLRLDTFTLQGIDADGEALAHGLLQITGGADIVVENVVVRDSDADGIAIANADDVRVRRCTVDNAGKSGLYLASCTNASVLGNRTWNTGGHRTAAGDAVGAGIQLSSCVNVVCADNLVAHGIGIGILCNANQGGAKPAGCVVRGNRISDVHNPTNPDSSGGIRCTNGNPDRRTNTLVEGNSIEDCGVYGLYLENHDGPTVLGNTIIASERSGIVVGTIDGVQLLHNVILDSDTSAAGQQAGIALINAAKGVVARGNVIANRPGLEPGYGKEGILDLSTGGGHSLEPRVLYTDAVPTEGTWYQGDLVHNTRPASGGFVGWVCVLSGSPGTWAGFGRIE